MPFCVITYEYCTNVLHKFVNSENGYSMHLRSFSTHPVHHTVP